MLKWLARLFWFGLLLLALGIGALAGFYFKLESELPDVTTLKDTAFETPMWVYSTEGAQIDE